MLVGEFAIQRPVTRSFDVFFDMRLNKGLIKQSWDWCFEALSLSCPLLRHCNVLLDTQDKLMNPTASTDCYVMVWLLLILPISFRITSLALGYAFDYHGASETTVKNMGEQQNKAQQNHVYVLYDVPCSTEAQEL